MIILSTRVPLLPVCLYSRMKSCEELCGQAICAFGDEIENSGRLTNGSIAGRCK
jgi:hypothetical protein